MEQTAPSSNQFSRVILRVLLSVGIMIFLLVCTALFTIYRVVQPVAPASQNTVDFIIPRGQSVAEIASRLEDQGLIRNAIAFRLVARVEGIEQRIQAGTFTLSAAQSTKEIALALTRGTEDVWITILEGWRAEEVAEYLAAQSLSNFEPTVFLKLSEQTAGKLFPDTYLVPREVTAEQLHALFTKTYQTKVANAFASEFESSPYSETEILTMASIIEREARDFEQMRHVSGILWNRIEIGMALQVDATLQFVEGYNAQTQSWWSPPDPASKALASPYNTYVFPGLPPGPIANPGLDAIKAALDPLPVNDLFYLHTRSGEMYYAETLEEHNANIDRYLR